MEKSISSLKRAGFGEQIAPAIQVKAAASPKRLTSGELFSGARELVIEHAGDEYYLRVTSQGKLILTK